MALRPQQDKQHWECAIRNWKCSLNYASRGGCQMLEIAEVISGFSKIVWIVLMVAT